VKQLAKQTVLCRVEKELLEKFKKLYPLETKRMTYAGVTNFMLEKLLQLEEVAE